MASPLRYGLVVIGAAVLTAGAPALASDEPAPAKQVEVVTIVPGPAGPTPAEIAKLETVTQKIPAPAVSPEAAAQAAIAMPALPPLAEKTAEITTIVIGPAEMTAAERAKIAAPAAPAPVAPAPASDAQAVNEKE